MRDRAIVRATVRELGPLWLGTLGVGVLVALVTADGRAADPGAVNTWPLVTLPIAALWGGLAVGGGTRERLVHLLSRPVPRLRTLAWRWGVLLLGLGMLAAPLWWLGLGQLDRGPSLGTIATATVLATVFGAQGAAVSDREPIALAVALMLGSALLAPVELTLEVTRVSWARVASALGSGGWPVVAVTGVVLALPVVWVWATALPVRGAPTASRTVLASLGASIACYLFVALPFLRWTAHPLRGELIAVIAATEDGPVVATGTLGRDGERDFVDGLVSINPAGERHLLWNRRDAAPDATLWHAAAQADFSGLRLQLVDGLEPRPTDPGYEVVLPVALVGEPPNPVALELIRIHRPRRGWDQAHGRVDAPFVAIHGNEVFGVDLSRPPGLTTVLDRARPSDIPVRRGGYAVAHGSVWVVRADGMLHRTSLPEASR